MTYYKKEDYTLFCFNKIWNRLFYYIPLLHIRIFIILCRKYKEVFPFYPWFGEGSNFVVFYYFRLSMKPPLSLSLFPVGSVPPYLCIFISGFTFLERGNRSFLKSEPFPSLVGNISLRAKGTVHYCWVTLST